MEQGELPAQVRLAGGLGDQEDSKVPETEYLAPLPCCSRRRTDCGKQIGMCQQHSCPPASLKVNRHLSTETARGAAAACCADLFES